MTSTAPVPSDAPVPRRVVRAWSIWDFGQQSFNTVIFSFVFSVYVVGLATTEAEGTATLTAAQTVAGVVIAVLAPALGTFSDRLRNSRLLLTITTLATIVAMAAMWFVEPAESYLLLGCILIAVASVFSELAGVFYNSMLLRISTPATYGRISGTAWGLGYIGGVLALVVALFGFVLDGGMLGLPTDGAENIRAIALMCAAWFLVFGMPLLLLAPREEPAAPGAERFSLVAAYRDLGRRLVHLWRSERVLLHFLVASAVFRDGLSTVFTVAGVLAANAYGFSPEEVIYFGLAANVVAGVSTWLAGRADDRVGPRRVIVASLAVIIVIGVVIILVDATLVFWVGGLLIAGCVGPVQSASRSMLARMTTTDTANENFGLYATTGRAVGFLGQAAFTFFVAVTSQTRLGTIGIILVIGIGLVLFLLMRVTERHHPLVPPDPPAERAAPQQG